MNVYIKFMRFDVFLIKFYENYTKFHEKYIKFYVQFAQLMHKYIF